jgi:hypothetical protein
LSLVFFAFLFFFCGNKFHSFPQKKMSPLKGNEIKDQCCRNKEKSNDI